MPRPLALGFCNARDVAAGGLMPVTHPAKDLEIAWIVSASERSRDDVINVPERRNLYPDFLTTSHSLCVR